MMDVDDKIRQQERKCTGDRRRLEDLLISRTVRLETKVDGLVWKLGLIWGGISVCFAIASFSAGFLL